MVITSQLQGSTTFINQAILMESAALTLPDVSQELTGFRHSGQNIIYVTTTSSR